MPSALPGTAVIRVLLVDDHELVRMGFRLVLETTSDIRVVAEVASGEQALAYFRSEASGGMPDAGTGMEGAPPAIDVILMDVSMPGVSVIEAPRQLLARDDRLRILGLSAHEDPSHVRHLLQAGGMGYLSKRTAPQVLIEAVRRVASGQRYLDDRLAQQLALQGLAEPRAAGRGQAVSASRSGGGNPASLSEREFEVFLHLARGRSVNWIADQLHISPRTAGTHLYNIKQKLGVGNQAELTLLAMAHRLLEV